MQKLKLELYNKSNVNVNILIKSLNCLYFYKTNKYYQSFFTLRNYN